ncbi:MAG: trypsin-like peptidase domain-containing protein [Caldilineales bacterium]|nr:trypsin-like peptidase domain-containing protein [Caldilineales bacterium]
MSAPLLRLRLSLVAAVLLVLTLSLGACGAARPDVEPTAAPTLDANAIVEQVVRRLATAESTDNGRIETIVQQVVQRLQAEANAQAGAPTATVAVALPQTSAPAFSSDLQQMLIDLYQRTNPAVVYIIVPNLGSGSGFVYDDEGHIVTNNHVVSGGSSFEVVFADGERQRATLVGRDVDSDLAVLKVGDLPAGVTPLPLAQPDAVQVGQFVVAIGNPFGEQGSMSLGIVSGLDRSLRSQRGATTSTNAYSLPEVIQTDAPINPGNSGGPLLNLAGEVVGINSAIATDTGVNSGVGFSIPVAAVRRIVPSLIETGSYNYPYLGVSFADSLSLSEQAAYGLAQGEGAYVLGVQAGGPAARAGLRAADASSGRGGDLVVRIDSQPIKDFSDLNSYLAFHTAVGQKITVTVLRNGRSLDLSLTLGARP